MRQQHCGKDIKVCVNTQPMIYMDMVEFLEDQQQFNEENLIDTKGVILSRKLKKDRKSNDYKKKEKRTDNDLQNTTQKTKD